MSDVNSSVLREFGVLEVDDEAVNSFSDLWELLVEHDRGYATWAFEGELSVSEFLRWAKGFSGNGIRFKRIKSRYDTENERVQLSYRDGEGVDNIQYFPASDEWVNDEQVQFVADLVEQMTDWRIIVINEPDINKYLCLPRAALG